MSQKKFDGVIETVRYAPTGEIDLVRVYEKRGATFSDHLLYTRKQLFEKLKAGKKFYVGKRVPFLSSTFEVSVPVLLAGQAGNEVIVSGRQRGEHDDLQGAPLF